VRDDHSSATPVARRFKQPTRTAGFGHRSRAARRVTARWPTPSLFGLAPGGVYHAARVAAGAVRSYRTFSPLPRRDATCRGGLFSVALSLGLPPPDVIRHRMSVEPGLSSPATFRPLPERPSGRLTEDEWGARPFPSSPCHETGGHQASRVQLRLHPRRALRKPTNLCILRSSGAGCVQFESLPLAFL
jgi:hypothetical protein